MHKKFISTINSHHIYLVVFVVVFGLSGLILLIASWAAPNLASFEAEDSTLSGNIAVCTDNTASQGSCIQFGSNTNDPPLESYDQLILNQNPVAYWAMNSQSSTEQDLTTNNRDGSYINGIPARSTLPNGDSVIRFNGSNQFMRVPTSTAFSIPTTRQFTWEAWIQPSTLEFPSNLNGYVNWMGKCETYSPTCEWSARMYSASTTRCNRISAYAFNNTSGLGSGAYWQPVCGLFSANDWLHVVGQYQTLTTPSPCTSDYPGTIDIWVNGVYWNRSIRGSTGCMSQYSVTPTASTSSFTVGTLAGSSYFSGSIGKVALYDYLLTEEQIQSHYTKMTNRTATGSCSSSCQF